jgi:flagellar biosynthesis protein FlhG
VVATPEPTSLTDAYATIKVLATTQGRRRIQLLVNQTRKAGEARAVRQQLQQVVDRYVNPTLDSPVRLDLLGEVPSDPAVREAVQRRQLLLELLPGTPPALALLAVAQRMLTP